MHELGYSFEYDVLNSNNYGIPQNRERIYMVCFRKDLDRENFFFPAPFKLENYLEDFLLPSKDTKKYEVHRNDLVLNKNADIEENLNKTIRVGTVGKGGQGERIYSPKGTAITLSANGGGAFAKTGGYLIDGKTRRLHPRECARIMGLPDSYKLHPNDNQAYKQLGNSVVIDVVQYITKQIGDSLNNRYSGVQQLLII